MGITGFCVHFILFALLLSVHSLKNDENGQSVIYPNAWPDFTVFHGGFPSTGLVQPRLNTLEFGFPVPLLTGNAIDARTTFAIKVMNSSWTGPAETNIYQRGEPVYLQVTSSGVPGQELYTISCYAAPSANPTDKSRSALIINKGCVSSKQPVMKFISRKSDSINLVLQTSSLKFSQMYVHCSVVLSGNGLTPETKCCNYNKNESKWVELGGQVEVCDCCATKCRGSPHYVHSFSEYKVVSTGPLMIKEQEHERWLSTATTSPQIEASSTSAGKEWITSEASSRGGGGWIASGGSVSSSSLLNRSPLWTQPAISDSVMVITQDLGGASSFWLPELVLDVRTSPVLEFGIGYPRQKGRGKISMLSQSSTSTESIFGKPESVIKATSQKNPLKKLPELESGHKELASNLDGYVADAPDMIQDVHLNIPYPVLEGFQKSADEKLRGDVFMIRESLLEKVPERADSTTPLLKSEIPEKSQGEQEFLVLTKTKILRKMKDVVPESVKRSKLTITQASDGSSLLSFEEEERSPSVDEQVVRKDKLELEQRKTVKGEKLGEMPEKFGSEEELVFSLLDLLRKLKSQ